MTVVIIGPPGSGKSSIGCRLARELDRPFVDIDECVVTEHGPISDIFARAGEDHFRRLERRHVQRALKGDGVVALGGGAALDCDTQRDLSSCIVILLSVSTDAVEDRLVGSRRPLVSDLDSWNALWETRRTLYESLADHEVDTSGRSPSDIVSEIAEWVRTHS